MGTGTAKTDDDRKECIRETLPSALPPMKMWSEVKPDAPETFVVMKKDDPDRFVLMRRNFEGYQWRVYGIRQPELLLSEETRRAVKQLARDGFDVEVRVIGALQVGKHTLYRTRTQPYWSYLQDHAAQENLPTSVEAESFPSDWREVLANYAYTH